jgi:hypothetical protein
MKQTTHNYSHMKQNSQQKPKDNREKLMELVHYYLVDLVNNESPRMIPELELRFTGVVGAEQNGGHFAKQNHSAAAEIPPISQEDYYSVLQIFKSLDASFSTTSSNEHLLRIYPIASSGQPPKSKIRCEITGILEIQKYCKTNDWRQCDQVKFVIKKPGQKLTKKYRKDNPRIQTEQMEPIPDVYMSSYAIKASYKHEIAFDKTQIDEYAETDPDMKFILQNWTTSVKKTFRHMNRFSFTIGEQGLVKMDASIVKSSSQDSHGHFLPAIDIHQSNVFENFPKYEIELEVNNENCCRGMPPPHAPPGDVNNSHLGGHAVAASRGLVGQSPDLLTDELMTTIRKVLMGLQKSRFPIPKNEMETVLEEYYRVVYGLKEKDNIRQVIRNDSMIHPKYFVGPSSVALKFEHLYPNGITDSHDPFVMENYTVTEKADGERCLLFVSPRTGKIYLIDMNMKIRFTGVQVKKADTIAELGGLIIDGEHVTKDIHDHDVSMFLAFDVYFRQGQDYRPMPFLNMTLHKNDGKEMRKLGRYTLLKEFIERLNHDSVTLPSSCLLGFKEFYVLETAETFGMACETVLSKYYPYKIDGLVFTPSYAAVGAEGVLSLDPGPKIKKRWPFSIKWKPAEYNTNDFLVTTVKTDTDEDEIQTHMEPDILTGTGSPLIEYKTLQLRCGFNRYTSGYPGAFLKILSLQTLDQLKEESAHPQKNDNYLPTLFYPTHYPDPFAHLCRVKLKLDSNGNRQMWTEDGEVIDDQTIVEFKYVRSNPDGFRWVPLRIRHDKTYEYRKGGKTYGNDYETANGNWNSMMNPITKEMLVDPQGALLPYEQVKMINDAYYDKTDAGARHVLQNFHGYIKFKLISSATLPGQTIIDLACGKAGDLWRWKSVQASFVFGVDYSRDNIENRFDGAAARYMNFYKNRDRPTSQPSARVSRKKRYEEPEEEKEDDDEDTNTFLRCVFVQGDVSKNVRSGEAMLNELSKEISDTVFGKGSPKLQLSLGERLGGIQSKGEQGFHVCSCQFALHYFFRDLPTLQGFMINVCQNVKKDGYFIGTCYDGKRVFDKLKNIPLNAWASIKSTQQPDEDYWVCTKKYTQNAFEDDSSSLGYQIDIFQKSIGTFHAEYLVNFDYLVRVMENYGFQKVDVTPFDQFYQNLDPVIAREQGFVGLTDLNEWAVSALNNTFKFKKVKDGFDPRNVVLDMEPIQEKQKEQEEEKEQEQEQEQEPEQEPQPEKEQHTPTSSAKNEPPLSLSSSPLATEKKRKSRKNKDSEAEDGVGSTLGFNKTKKNKTT